MRLTWREALYRLDYFALWRNNGGHARAIVYFESTVYQNAKDKKRALIACAPLSLHYF